LCGGTHAIDLGKTGPRVDIVGFFWAKCGIPHAYLSRCPRSACDCSDPSMFGNQ
jgi:hypothetical protein